MEPGCFLGIVKPNGGANDWRFCAASRRVEGLPISNSTRSVDRRIRSSCSRRWSVKISPRHSSTRANRSHKGTSRPCTTPSPQEGSGTWKSTRSGGGLRNTPVLGVFLMPSIVVDAPVQGHSTKFKICVKVSRSIQPRGRIDVLHPFH